MSTLQPTLLHRIRHALAAAPASHLTLSIAGRLFVGFGVVLAMFAGSTFFAVWQMRGMERDMNSALQAATDIAGQATLMRRSIDRIFMSGTLLMLSTQKDEFEYLKGEIRNARIAYFQAKQQLTAAASSGADSGELPIALSKLNELEVVNADIDRAVERRRSHFEGTDETAEADLDLAMITHMATNVKSQSDLWAQAVDVTVKVSAQIAAARQTRATSTAELARKVQVAAAAVALLLGVAGARFIARSVTRPIGTAVGVAERVSKGELSISIPAGGRDETGLLLHALSRMQGSLRDLVGEVRDSARSIGIASAEVAAGNNDLSQRTEVAAGQLQHTPGSVQQLSGAARQAAASAQTADTLARGAAAAAMQGSDVVKQAVESMESITLHARKIGEITGTIDSLAFQTNILALNAAVEAARAGEQGRGFAVVAGEVRQLAQRSSAAAKDIRSLISTSVNSVEYGSRLVQDAGRTMLAIVDSVRQVSTVIAEITAASAAQSVGVTELGQAMDDIDRMTQQNAALVEQGAAAAESLKSQAERLTSLVETFKLDHEELA